MFPLSMSESCQEENLFKDTPYLEEFNLNIPELDDFPDIPEAESFIQNENEGDPFRKIFCSSNTGSSYSVETLSEGTSTNKSRANRWLKWQDRKLVKTILTLQQQERIYPELLFDNINKNSTTKSYWDLVKTGVETNRSLGFLQTRYRKLLRNQELNRHEKLYFEENYTKYTIEEFQILFAGKTKSTLVSLKAQLEKKSALNSKADKILDMLPQKRSEIIETLPTSNLVSTMMFKKDLTVGISPYFSLATSESLEQVAPKALRKMQYTMDQISGEIYSKLYALKASLKEDLAKGL
ncbi:unnamed protein product [Moneuplotes crassus]|uniref:Uncharacterized protein n=1 Tax=Euplotes crassus TaxID=5936 RepID=A0AAD1X8N1_EUPCR|nr:unnamed protein product [Moneuplotes crassus]